MLGLTYENWDICPMVDQLCGNVQRRLTSESLNYEENVKILTISMSIYQVD